MFREGVRQILELASDIEVVGEAKDGIEAERKAAELQPHVILMDLNMPGVDGVTCIRRLAESQPHIRVIVLTMHRSDRYLFEALKAGAHGYILKDASAQQLVRAIREVSDGLSPVDPSLSPRLLSEFRRLATHNELAGEETSLTDKEKQVLRLVAAGLSNKDIAARLFLAEKTVKNYLTNIFQKLGVTSRVQAAIYAQQHGLAAGDDPDDEDE